jgi:hypothetical protein
VPSTAKKELKTYAIYCNGYPARQLGGPKSSVKAFDKQEALKLARVDYTPNSDVTVKLVR